jgi:hypothetical protein
MSLTDVLPEVQTLSRLDKIRLIQFLAQELVQDEEGLIEPVGLTPSGRRIGLSRLHPCSCKHWRTGMRRTVY